MKLTSNQEQFAQNVAQGMSQSDAYRAAYPMFNGKDSTCWEKASRLMGKVEARLAELREETAKRKLWTREMSIKGLAQAFKEGNAAAKVAAIKELNAMHGFNAPQKHEHGGGLLIHVRYDD